MKLCVGASSGGHMNELMSLLNTEHGQLLKPELFITTDVISLSMLRKSYKNVYAIGECSRATALRIPIVILKAFFVAVKEKPDVVITTGSFPLAIFSRFAKFWGSKVIWIDSIANIHHLTASGKWALSFADRVYAQWPKLSYDDERIHYAGYLL